MPASNNEFIEEPVVDEGLDGRKDIRYYKQSLKLQYLQSDLDTLGDLYSSAFDSYFNTTGTSTEITFLNGESITLTMFFKRRAVAAGYQTVMYVELEAMSTTLTSVFA
jgi:hypothetical protein